MEDLKNADFSNMNITDEKMREMMDKLNKLKD